MTQCEPGEEIITVITCEYIEGVVQFQTQTWETFLGTFLRFFGPEERGAVRGGVTL